MTSRCLSDGHAQYGTTWLGLGLFACLYLSFSGRPPPPVGFGPFGMSRGVGGFVLFRLAGGGGGGGVSFVGVCCVLCFLDPVLVVYVHSVRPWKTLLFGGVSVWNCGPGGLWVPLKISRSLCTILLVILGCAYIGGLGGAGVGASDRAVRFWAPSPSETNSFSGIHACLCSAVMSIEISVTPRRCRVGRGAIGSSRQNFAGTVHCHVSEVFSSLHDILLPDSCNFFLRCPCHHACG